MAYTAQDVAAFIAANPQMSPDEILQTAIKAGVSAQDLYAGINVDGGRFQGATFDQVAKAYEGSSPVIGGGSPAVAQPEPTPTQTPVGTQPTPTTAPVTTTPVQPTTTQQQPVVKPLVVDYGLPPALTLSPGATTVPTTSTGQDLARMEEAKVMLGAGARGQFELTPTLTGTAQPTNLDGTITGQQDVVQIGEPAKVEVTPTQQAPVITAQQAGVQQAVAPAIAPPALVTDVAQVAAQAPTTAAQGAVSEQAIAQPVATPTLSTGATAQAQTVEALPGSTVEAAVGQMTPEAFAEAAKVAGLEAARVDRAKTQLRKAGLTEAQIAAFANNPAALEMELSNFTEEQRGLIGGLPTEALVSAQLDALLQGIETGETPAWARPAVAAVEQMLVRRGMDASTVGRDALVDAIIQSAMPLAQQNAQAIQQSIAQQKNFEQQAAITEAQFKQQTNLQNAQAVFNLNLANLSNEQQARVANAQFVQTMSLTNANNKQQAAMQNAVALAQLDLATLDANTKLAAQNAQAFLQMDLTNLSNKQQAMLLDTQFEQQRLLSNQAATNAAKQFNAASQQQADQFMASLAANISQFNATQYNAMQQFNAVEANKTAAINAGNTIAVDQFNTQLMAQVDQFNAQQELMIEQWNAANRQAIEQSNVQWRRQANTADTAAQNAVNQQNVQNAFNMSLQAQAALWQELRDRATFDLQAYENRQDREAQLYASAIGNESAAGRNYDATTHLVNLAKSFFGGTS